LKVMQSSASWRVKGVIEVCRSVTNRLEKLSPFPQAAIDQLEVLHLRQRLMETAFFDALVLACSFQGSAAHNDSGFVGLRLEALPGLVVSFAQLVRYLPTEQPFLRRVHPERIIVVKPEGASKIVLDD